ncbi:unnamed protein product [Musa textilis]
MVCCFLHHLLLMALLLAVAGSDTDPGDLAAMQAIAAGLGANRSPSLAWSPSADPCSAWAGVSCTGGRVTAIQAGNCSLSGSLPSAVRSLTALTRLELQQNRLSGPLPSLAGLAALQVLLLHGNHFSALPGDFFTGLTSLQSAFIDNNPLAPWPLPDSLRDARPRQLLCQLRTRLRAPPRLPRHRLPRPRPPRPRLQPPFGPSPRRLCRCPAPLPLAQQPAGRRPLLQRHLLRREHDRP